MPVYTNHPQNHFLNASHLHSSHQTSKMLRYDPATLRSTQRSSLGITRENRITRTSNTPDPSRGGTRGYPLHLRSIAIETFIQTDSVEDAAASVNCSVSSVYRWIQRPLPYRMTGGRLCSHLTGADQLFLSVCLYIYTDASADELTASIYANGGGVYERYTIYRHYNELGLSRKRSSKEAYEVLSPSSLQKY